MRVVVIGSGLAGLAAARRLQDQGAEPIVVEAGLRLGGRVRTVRDRFVSGQHVESGAEWVDTHHHLMLELMSRHGCNLEGEGQTWSAIRRFVYRDAALTQTDGTMAGIADELDALEEHLSAYAKLVPDASRPHELPAAAALDERSFAEMADEANLSELARLFHHRNSQGEFADETNNVSLLFVAQQRAQDRDSRGAGDSKAHRIEGGLDRLIAAMASDLTSPVALGERAQIVGERGDGVRVTTDRRVIDADAVIMTTTLVAMRDIRLDFDVDALLIEAIHSLGYGTVTKTAVQFERRAWANGYATTDTLSQRIYEPTVDQRGNEGALVSYCGGDGGRALAHSTEVARLDAIETDMRMVHGLSDARTGGFSRAWSTEPRYGGSYAVYRPGQVVRYWDVLRRPHGPMHLAGEHTASWTGYMEGAVESGHRAASRITSA